jgi:DNA helicase HerA-like ATPase
LLSHAPSDLRLRSRDPDGPDEQTHPILLNERGINAREWIEPASKSWPTFGRVIEILKDKGTAAASLVTRLSMLSDLGLFGAGNFSFETFLNKRVCLKFSDLPNDEVKAALAEILIVQLHGHVLRGDQPRRLTRMIVFDEAHRVKDSKRLEQLAREGRAFGVGIVIGTQFPDDIPETMAGNLATQLFLMNNQATHRRLIVTQLLGTTATSEAKGLLDKLGQLRPLQGLFANTHNNGVFVNILPHYMRHPA